MIKWDFFKKFAWLFEIIFFGLALAIYFTYFISSSVNFSFGFGDLIWFLFLAACFASIVIGTMLKKKKLVVVGTILVGVYFLIARGIKSLDYPMYARSAFDDSYTTNAWGAGLGYVLAFMGALVTVGILALAIISYLLPGPLSNIFKSILPLLFLIDAGLFLFAGFFSVFANDIYYQLNGCTFFHVAFVFAGFVPVLSLGTGTENA